MSLILNGKQLASIISAEIAQQTAVLAIKPRLAIILVGNNLASEIYIRNKISCAKSLNIETQLIRLPSTATKNNILEIIKSLNEDPTINGIIVQAPLPNKNFQETVFEAIDPRKDVDGFTPANIGRLCNGNRNCLVACTPLGIWKLLSYYNISLSGKHVVILGRSRIVGRPLSILLSQKFEGCNATVTVCNSQTKHLAEIAQSGDILISAIGNPKFVTKNIVKCGAVVVDVGINRIPDNTCSKGYRLSGDVDFEHVQEVCSAITPVPGGVGPMTIAMLMHNTLQAFELQNKRPLTE